jgi:hypothetical protein
VELLLEYRSDVQKQYNSSKVCLRADVHKPTADGLTPLFIASAGGYTEVVALLIDNGAKNESVWMGLSPTDSARVMNRSGTLATLGAYESQFQGFILPERGVPCVVSWPGVYARLWDKLVAKGKASELSAAVVFLPERTASYGRCGSDKCYCVEMYGKKKPWGCRWFQIWREHVTEAVARDQTLRVFFFEGLVGCGKVLAWEVLSTDAARRDDLHLRKGKFLNALPLVEKQLLATFSDEPRDDSKNYRPGSDRVDEEERLFVMSLSDEDKDYIESHKGLGNSQKAEVAWLEKMGYAYEQIDVRDFQAPSS